MSNKKFIIWQSLVMSAYYELQRMRDIDFKWDNTLIESATYKTKRIDYGMLIT